jgi:hypothetical protein
MKNGITGILVLIFIGGAIYFWQRAMSIGLSLSLIIISYLFFPIASLLGLYWLIKDIYFFYKQ